MNKSEFIVELRKKLSSLSENEPSLDAGDDDYVSHLVVR